MVSQTVSIPKDLYRYIEEYQVEKDLTSFSKSICELARLGRVRVLEIEAQERAR